MPVLPRPKFPLESSKLLDSSGRPRSASSSLGPFLGGIWDLGSARFFLDTIPWYSFIPCTQILDPNIFIFFFTSVDLPVSITSRSPVNHPCRSPASITRRIWRTEDNRFSKVIRNSTHMCFFVQYMDCFSKNPSKNNNYKNSDSLRRNINPGQSVPYICTLEVRGAPRPSV
jgi:hypothetical protein